MLVQVERGLLQEGLAQAILPLFTRYLGVHIVHIGRGEAFKLANLLFLAESDSIHGHRHRGVTLASISLLRVSFDRRILLLLDVHIVSQLSLQLAAISRVALCQKASLTRQ